MQTGLKDRLVEAGHGIHRVGAGVLINVQYCKAWQGLYQAATQSSDTMSVQQLMKIKKREMHADITSGYLQILDLLHRLMQKMSCQ